MINHAEKASIKDKVMTIAQMSNLLIKFSEGDTSSKEVAVMIQGMIKDFIKFIDEMKTSQKTGGNLGRKKGSKYKMIRIDDGEQQEQEEEEPEVPKLSPLQIAARDLINGRNHMQASSDEYKRGGRPLGSKNKVY